MPPAIPDKIPCDTEQQLQREINDLRDAIDREETEDSWEQILRALARFKAIVRGGGYKHDSFVPSLKPISRLISTPMLSERGRLLAVAIDLVSTLASALGKRFDPLMSIFAPAILKLCQRPNKVVLTRAQGCLTMVIKQTRLSSILPFLRESVKDKSATLRIVSSEAIYLCMTTIEPDKLANRVSDLESIIKTTGRDANPEVRKQARAILTEYREKFPDRIPAFIHPLTPVTRKYLEVQKFANLMGTAEPLALKLSGPTAKPTAPKATQASEPQMYRPPPAATSNGPRPTRRGDYAIVPSHSVLSTMDPPPRPHSSASTARPRRAPAASNGISNARPLSAHVVGYMETERPRSMLVEWNQRLELQRQQSRDNASNYTGAVAFPSTSQPAQREPDSSTSREVRDRQRSASVTNGQLDVNRALGIVQSLKDFNVGREERRDNGHDHPPRPPSVASDRPPFTRPKSVLSTRSNGVLSLPISTTSDTLEQGYGDAPPAHSQDTRATSPLGPSKPARGYERPQISRYGQTPKTAVERPAVVYLPSVESVVPAPPHPQKTWSLSYQMELLNNKKKKAEGLKLEDANTVSPIDSTSPSSMPIVADALETQPEIGSPVEEIRTEPMEAVDVQPVSTMDQTEHKREVAAPNEPIAFPTQGSEGGIVPMSSKYPMPQVQAPSAVGAPVNEDARSRTISSSSKGTRVVVTVKPVAPLNPVPRVRTVSASKMPVRPPSRSTFIQPAGFVPKRTVKNSIAQPTKSQAARAQAVMNEKSAAIAKVGTVPGLTASTSAKSSHDSTKRSEGTVKEVAPPSTSGFKPTSKTILSSTTPGANARTREAPRKPPVPTVSSLIKTHAARREAGLATVSVKLGAAPNPSARGTTAPRTKAQATVSSKKTILSIEANNSKNQNTGAATSKELSAMAPVPTPSVPVAFRQAVAFEQVISKAEAGGSTMVFENKADTSVILEATLPLPSSSFATRGEMVGTTLKQSGETCAVPVIGGNQSSTRLLKELRVS